MIDQERRVVDRALAYRARTEQTPETLSGYAAIFDTETVIAGLFREVIRPGAFAGAVGRDDVRALFNHDPNFVLGRTTSGTLVLAEDATGLSYTVTPPETTWAKDLVTSVSRGDVTQSSFAFRVVQEKWPTVARDAMALREILAVELFDVSPVTYPAYETTTVSARARAAAVSGERMAQARRRNQLIRAGREAL
jgi:hypothetical protein